MADNRERVEETYDEAELTLPPEAEADEGWAGLLRYLLVVRGFDFHGYKPATLGRRIRKRMTAVHADSYAAYQDYLEVHPDEFATLFDTILINVTGFFRDPSAWDAIRTQLVPHLLASKAPDESVRAWSAGCASGEEAYTLAMILAEEMGGDDFRERVKIYATDMDEDALNAARHASYSPRQVEGMPPEMLERYFEPSNGSYIFRKDLRRQVIFGRHDLINDAPISRIDLIVCRNTLMYFNAETQAKVLSRFNFALKDGGYLFLGRAETMMTHGESFVPMDLKRRISRKLPTVSRRERLAGALRGADSAFSEEASINVHAAALELSPVAQIVVNAAGVLTLANERARLLFSLPSSDVGRPLRDLQLSYRPVELRSIIEQAETDRRTLTIKDVEWRPEAGEPRCLDIQVAPLGDRAAGGSVITFTDVSAYRRLQGELEHSHQALETAYEELQSTNEELETTNEELQSTVEELETTNEELQSTNEELETMNEELQSTNEELQTINDELRQRGDDLNSANAFMHSVLGSLQVGVAVVDRELRLLAWSRHAEDLWGLRPGEVKGQHLLNLDIGLPLERLRPVLRACLNGETALEQLALDSVNRRGKSIKCDVTCTPLLGPGDEVRGVILLMEESPGGRS